VTFSIRNPITHINAREVLDSRGRPTVEVEAGAGEFVGRAIVPSGASTGAAEALELRDGEKNWYDGKGVRAAVKNVNEVLAPAIIGMDPHEQAAIDQKLIEVDGTPQKSNLGGNAVLGISLAVAHLAAAVERVPLWKWLRHLPLPVGEGRGEGLHLSEGGSPLQKRLDPHPNPLPQGEGTGMPLPMTNMISGGLHAGGNIDFQDVLVIPDKKLAYPAQLEQIVRIYNRLGKLLTTAGYEGRLVGDEGGYGPRLPDNRTAVQYVVAAIEAAGFTPGEVTIALDVAATHFYRHGQYYLKTERGRALSAEEMIDRMEAWVSEFPIVSIEDALAEEDWEGWQQLTARLGSKVQLVGDDLFTTNPERVRRGIELGVANSVLVKVNQIGTLTETFQTMQLARDAGYSLVVSARSGETEDTTIADLAVAVAADFIKIGSIVRSERLAKYNQLLRIAEELSSQPEA
jgi:enolase